MDRADVSKATCGDGIGPWDGPAAERMMADLRWPEGPVCPFCGAGGPWPLRIESVRRRRLKCARCRRQFSVTKDTILEGSRLPLETWIAALMLICDRPAGISVAELGQALGISHRAARNICDRLRYARGRRPLGVLLSRR